jgi:phospho-N-acetylmuramoyl-pentapeptide-transferase
MVKAGTPTFGGLLIFGVALPLALVAAVPQDADMLLPIAVAAALVAVGFYDDMGTLIDRENREAHDRTTMVLKLIAFAVIGVVASLLLYDGIDAPRLLVPHYGSYDIGPIYVLIAIGVIVATTAAVGVSDGLDMLCGSTSAAAVGAFGIIALMQDQDALATFCFALVGALLGFLWHNAYPARIFMGDTGSLPLGATLAVVALMTGWWLLVPLIGVIFVAEILSNIIQIGYFRMTGGKRVFRMAPLHHHFEKLGVPEVQITMRFLIVGLLGALAGIALAALD